MVGKLERRKDVVQVTTESAATRLGHIALILTGAVRDIARELGDFVSDVADIAEAARRAREDAEATSPPPRTAPPPGAEGR